MSVITIQTSQGLKQVRIAGEEPTPEELERVRYLSIRKVSKGRRERKVLLAYLEIFN